MACKKGKGGKRKMNEKDIQTTFNTDSIEVLVVEGAVENVESIDEN